MRVKTCHVCGLSCNCCQHEFYWFSTVRGIYSVGYFDICQQCGDTANSFVSYYGEKKPEDKAKLHKFLISGALPMRDYSALMNAGYFSR